MFMIFFCKKIFYSKSSKLYISTYRGNKRQESIKGLEDI